MIYSSRLSSPNLHPQPLISSECCWKSGVGKWSLAWGLPGPSLYPCEMSISLLANIERLLISPFFTDNICVIQTRRWMVVLWGHRSCEGLKAAHLLMDIEDQREYYLKWYLVISTSSGLYGVLFNWADAGCHQTPDLLTIRCLYKELHCPRITQTVCFSLGEKRSWLP